jgi:ATP-dependent DNA ligase
MTARVAAALPDAEHAENYAFEPKVDGWRALAFRSSEGVYLQSRQQRPLGRYFPDVVGGLLAQVPAGTVLDGELVVIRDGGFDFTALQRRIHPSSTHAAGRAALAPASFIVFDLLAVGGGACAACPTAPAASSYSPTPSRRSRSCR